MFVGVATFTKRSKEHLDKCSVFLLEACGPETFDTGNDTFAFFSFFEA